MISWLKKLVSIVKSHDRDVRQLHSRMDSLDKLIRDRTDIAVDIGYQDADHVIVFGRYKGVDYVQSYAINTQDFAEIIRILNAMRQHARVRRIDAPPTFHAVFERILK